MLITNSPSLSLKLLSIAVSLAVTCCSSSPQEKVAAVPGTAPVAGVPAWKASRLRSCLLVLSPVQPVAYRGRRKVILEADDAKVMYPPPPVMKLARLAVAPGADHRLIHRALHPTELLVPGVDGPMKNKCNLTRTPQGRRFADKEINSYFEFLFELIVARGPSVGLNVSLSRYDLFHGHLFLAFESRRLGILFHAKEYPASNDGLFPMSLGFCQTGSNVPYDDPMNLRNILWLAPLISKETEACLEPGVLVVLDARPDGIIYQDLISEGVQAFRTIYEADFGDVAADVNYLNVGNAASRDRIFVCCHPSYTP